MRQLGSPPAEVLGAGASRSGTRGWDGTSGVVPSLCLGQGGCLVGRRTPRPAGRQSLHCETCPPATSSPSTVGNAGGPLGASCHSCSGAVLPVPLWLGKPQQKHPRRSRTPPTPASQMSLEIKSHSCQRKVWLGDFSKPGCQHLPVTATLVSYGKAILEDCPGMARGFV